MPELIPPHIREIVTARMSRPVSEPPTMKEVEARIIIVTWLLEDYRDDLLPDGPLKDRWDLMMGADDEDMIAEGMAILWP